MRALRSTPDNPGVAREALRASVRTALELIEQGEERWVRDVLTRMAQAFAMFLAEQRRGAHAIMLTCGDGMLMADTERLAQEVHSAWRDGMLGQGRDVALTKRDWDTLREEDKVLDRYIASRVAHLVLQAMGVSEPAPPTG